MFRYVLKAGAHWYRNTVLTFISNILFDEATPGSPISGEKYKNEAAREIAIKKYNLDKPVFEQYTLYMNDLIHGDLGESIVRPGRDVGTTISQSFPVTARLGAIAFASALVIGVALGTAAALSKRKWLNNLCMFIATIRGICTIIFDRGTFNDCSGG